VGSLHRSTTLTDSKNDPGQEPLDAGKTENKGERVRNQRIKAEEVVSRTGATLPLRCRELHRALALADYQVGVK
jgi:hypothetical protein